MAKPGLKEWFKQDWRDISTRRKDGSFAKCGRTKQKKDAKRKYPKCVPAAKGHAGKPICLFIGSKTVLDQ